VHWRFHVRGISEESGLLAVAPSRNRPDARGFGYVLDDLSGRYPPHDWAKRAIAAYGRYAADRIVAETNFGGAMVESTILSIDANVPFKAVSASRGKAIRAEPISALYEQNRVKHCGSFGTFEDQMCGFSATFDPRTKPKSGSSNTRGWRAKSASAAISRSRPCGRSFRRRQCR